jgi:hypothetical protein
MDINEHTFTTWVKKYRSNEQEKGFTQVQIIPPSSSRPGLFAEVNGIKLYAQVPADYLKALLQ